MNQYIAVAILLFAIGIVFQILIRRYLKYLTKKQAKTIAEDIIDSAKDKFDEAMDKAKESASDFEQEMYDKNADHFDKMENNIGILEERIEATRAELQSSYDISKNKYHKQSKVISRKEDICDAKRAKFKFVKDETKNIKTKYIDQLCEAHQLSKEEFIGELSTKLEQQTHQKATDYLEEQDQLIHLHQERNAKKIINIALNRFKRPFCPERGIGFLIMKTQNDAKKMLGPDNKNIAIIEELCGVDIIYNENANSLSVSGFDPVRRELGRLVIEYLYKQKYVEESTVHKALEKSKKTLFKKISDDGIRIAKELKLQNLSKEVRNMMGALRYRYSFTQNQYFHCAEVGHLCGLLAAELDEQYNDARRAGMLHDIGKAMDHSIDGGHAVIGADFIEKNGENEKIVHAVRAHHFDEQPETPLSFLVIGADALSGARPGARRSTAVSYHQKMDQLLEIGNSFEGVIDTFILSAGREVRITVDSHSVDDLKALNLSQEIADKIEKECNYPGTIKVTVVRSTQAIEVAK